MNYFTEINGLPIQASYTQKNIEEIFFPLLQHLTDSSPITKKSTQRLRDASSDAFWGIFREFY